MKLVTIILTVIALALIGYNFTMIDSVHLLKGDSFIAVITIVLSLCAILLLQILRISQKIEKLSKQRKNV